VKPSISKLRVVIPAYKTGDTIVACVEALFKALNFIRGTEVVVVDNGGNSDLAQLLKNFPVNILKRTQKQSAAYARNEGARDFNEGILVFIDSDVIVEPKCVERLISPLLNGECDATIGNYSKKTDGLNFAQAYKQLYISHIYERKNSGIRNDFWTAIAAVKAGVFNELNGFDASFKGANGEDQELGIRLTKANFKVMSVTDANGQHRNPYTVAGIIKNDFRKGLTAVQNSVNNKVSLKDNRHAQLTDILAVVFSASVFPAIIAALWWPQLWILSTIFFLSWFLCRRQLAFCFLTKLGLWFFLRSLVLMFLLDITRFLCVVIATFKFKLLRSSQKSNQAKIHTPIKQEQDEQVYKPDYIR
jgi:cellulose synthase/poly-beta-1,6-N-acetylglucosamine synthase-like glycosyltransferase